MSRGNENFICGPMIPESVRQEIGWQYVPYEKFILTANALRSVAHVIGFNVRPLYLECGCNLDDTGIELSKRLIVSVCESLFSQDEIPDRRRFFMRIVGRDPDKTRYPMTFPSFFQASRGEAAKNWAVSAPDGKEVLTAAETLLEFSGLDASEFIALLKKESPEFDREDALEAVRASIIHPSGYIPRLITAARAAADYNTYFLSWWS